MKKKKHMRNGKKKRKKTRKEWKKNAKTKYIRKITIISPHARFRVLLIK
jgi:DNA topoisomerase VI subunit B